MIDKSEVKTYFQDDVLWTEASREVAASSQAAWEAIEPLFERLTEIGTPGGAEIEVIKKDPDASLVAEGNQLAVLVTRLAIFKTVMIITFEDVELERRASCCITVLGSRYGVPNRTYRSQHVPDHLPAEHPETGPDRRRTRHNIRPPRKHIPEVAQVHTLWEELAVGTGQR